ncbi:MAG: hypothetical protein PVH60_02890 [Anaerolineales bacterium]|jgi:hypothetical protein
MRERKDVVQVKEKHKKSLLTMSNVVGVGTGFKSKNGRRGDLCVVALVSQKVPRAGLAEADIVPREIDGVSTDVIQVGQIRAHPARTDRWRPALGGVSIGHVDVTAGTLGVVVRDRASGRRLVLSNNHVLANSNQAEIGDSILQPGRADGGTVAEDVFATLLRACPIAFTSGPPTCSLALAYASFGNTIAKLAGSKHRIEATWSDPQAVNRVDAAVAQPLQDQDLLDEIYEIGLIKGSMPAELGMNVRKSGRTTGLTNGQIIVLDATVKVQYGARTAQFEDQIVSTAMSQPGDSGSLLVAGEALLAVGLLFAGSDQATIYNPIDAVLSCLDVEL